LVGDTVTALGSGTGLINFVNGANPWIVYTNATERARIDSSGNLGIGVTNPNAPLDIKSGSSANAITIRARAGNDFSFLVFRQADGTEDLGGIANQRTAANTGNLLFYTAGGGSAAERARIDSSGRFMVGTTSAIGSSTGTFVAANDVSAVYAGTATQGLYISANATSRYVTYASSGNLSGGHVWNVGNSEVARIDLSGNLLVGTTSSEGPSKLSVVQSTANQAGIGLRHTLGAGETFVRFLNAANSAVIGSITNNANTGVLYNTTSDYRLKENIQDAAPASALIDSLQVRQYDWKSDGTRQRYGFVAQELVTVAPEAVHQPADPEEMMAVDYSKLVPMLVKEIQSLRKRLAAAGI
jgi:hypothetical protein